MPKKRFLFIVFLALVILFSQTFKAEETKGCFFHPDFYPDYYCQDMDIADASVLCDEDQTCLNQFFQMGKTCDELNECKKGFCKTGDNACQSSYQGICGKDNFIPLEDKENYSKYCEGGCCKYENNCMFYQTYAKCEEIGGLWNWTIKTKDECAKLCQVAFVTKKANLSGYVWNQTAGKLLKEALIKIDGEEKGKTNEGGFYQIKDLIAKEYSIEISFPGFTPIKEKISLKEGENQKNFTLPLLGETFTLKGFILDQEKKPISGATIKLNSWQTISKGYPPGEYLFENLPSGDYQITISEKNHQTHQEPISINKSLCPNNLCLENFTLSPLTTGIKVCLFDLSGEEISSGIRTVYLSNGLSKYYPFLYNNNCQKISLPPGNYTLKTIAQGFEPNTTKTTVGKEGYQEVNLSLKPIEECYEPVEELIAHHVKGKKQVKLTWQKPCYSTQYFVINKTFEGKTQTFPENSYSSSPEGYYLTDENVSWGKTYTYQIWASYEKGGEPILLGPANVTITFGDEICQGKENVYSFCNDDLTKILYCNEENKVTEQNCSSPKFCWQKTKESALCALPESCGPINLLTLPFGLYHLSEEKCSGTKEKPLPCYFDIKQSIVEGCYPCSEIKSCFDYRSKEACSKNNCLKNRECQWIGGAEGTKKTIIEPLIPYQETGAGYCVEKNYQKSDKCALCGQSVPPSRIYENFFCSDVICRGLGKCYSQEEEETCQACTKYTTCYDYQSQLECEGGSSFEINNFKEIASYSNDSCGLKRCAYIGTECIKDGDYNQKDDCGDISCKQDYSPPETKVISPFPLFISQVRPTINFSSQDNYGIKSFSFCLSSIEKCENFTSFLLEKPDQIFSFGPPSTIVINLLNYLKDKTIDGETYKLRYFALDQNNNQESAKEVSVFIDNQPPLVEINYTIKPLEDKKFSDITVKVAKYEETECKISLAKQYGKKNETEKKTFGFEENVEHTFSSKIYGLYNLTVSCSDGVGNTIIGSYQLILSNPNIKVIKPEKILNNKTVEVEIETTFPASCELIDLENYYEFELSPHDKFTSHHFIFEDLVPKEYLFSISCQDLLTGEAQDSFLIFNIDLLGPPIKAKITEKTLNKKYETTSQSWEQFFINQAEVELICLDEDNHFPCQKINYCFAKEGEKCSNFTSGEKNIILKFNESGELHYYGLDTANQKGPYYLGKIKINDFGIKLEEPKFGVSNQKTFKFAISTSIPSQECKVSLVKDFDFDKTINPKQIFSKKNDYNFYFSSFPNETFHEFKENKKESFYVKCSGQIENQFIISKPKEIVLQYDPTPPKILEFKAVPEIVVYNKASLKIKTDDPSFCRYDDKPIDEKTYSAAKTFPGYHQIENLTTQHEITLPVTSKDDKKNFTYFARCENGAGNLSEEKNTTFFVDFSKTGKIISKYPDGLALKEKEVDLVIETSLTSQWCQYLSNGSSEKLSLENEEGTKFKAKLTNLTEKKYSFPIQCLIGSNLVEDSITFWIDQTPPFIVNITHHNVSCSDKEIQFTVEAKDNVSQAEKFECLLYQKGNQTPLINHTKTGNLIVIKAKDLGLKNFSLGKEYYLKARPIDQAGNLGEWKESSPILITNSSHPDCIKDLSVWPESEEDDKTCRFYISLKTNLPAAISYGLSLISKCQTNNSYQGKFSLNKTSYLCYNASNEKKKTPVYSKLIVYPDDDKDGVINACDKCKNTLPSMLVDENGCSVTENKLNLPDTDKDKLSDAWEKKYSSKTCLLDWNNSDSDNNKVPDDEEDYDNDGYNNYKEFLLDLDPCKKDNVDLDNDGILDHEDKCKDTPVAEITQVVKDKNSPHYGCSPSQIKKPPEEEIEPEEEKAVFLWILLIVGLLMIISGSLILLYQYKLKEPKKREEVKEIKPKPEKVRPEEEKWQLFKKKTLAEEKRKAERKKVFSVFEGEETKKEEKPSEEEAKPKEDVFKKLEKLIKKK